MAVNDAVRGVSVITSSVEGPPVYSETGRVFCLLAGTTHKWLLVFLGVGSLGWLLALDDTSFLFLGVLVLTVPLTFRLPILLPVAASSLSFIITSLACANFSLRS